MKKITAYAAGLILALSAGQSLAINTQFNVLGAGARPNAPTFNNATAIAAANAAAAAVKGSVYNPAGVYWTGPISTPIGYFSVFGDNVPTTKYPNQAGTVWKLKNNTTGPLLTVSGGSGVYFNGIFFDGNGTNQTVASDLVHINPEIIINNSRNETVFENCVFFNSKGVGFYNETRAEVTLKFCSFSYNGSHGYESHDCTDLFNYHLLSGFNGGDGYHLVGNNGSGRWQGLDSYFNQGHGLFLSGPVGACRFMYGEINKNFKDGIHLEGIVDRMWFSDMIVFGANTAHNSLGVNNPATNYTYSDVFIGDSIFTGTLVFKGSYGVADGEPPTKFPAYVFRDERTGVYSQGLGISIDGVVARSNGTNLISSFNSQEFEKNAMMASVTDFSGVGYGTRVGGSRVHISGPFVMDGNTVRGGTNAWSTNTFTIYNPYPTNSTTFFETRGENGSFFWGFFGDDGKTLFPGSVFAEGSFTNNGTIENRLGQIYLYDHFTNRTALVYNIGNGGLGLSASAGVDPKFSILYPNGLFSTEHSLAFSHVVTEATLESVLSENSQINDSAWFQQEAGGMALRTYIAGIPYITRIQPAGNWTFANDVSIPGVLSVGLMNLNAMNTGTLTVTTNLVFSKTNSVPANTNAVLWLPVVFNGMTGSVPWMANP